MSRRVMPAMTVLQRRAIHRRLMRNRYGQDTPVRASFVGERCPVPAQYSPGAPGYTVRVVAPVRIPSRNETRLECPPEVEALIGTLVDGSLFNPGPIVDLEPLQTSENDIDETPTE